MFKTVIGLEIHVQLKTKSKMFCRCDNNAEGAAPNTLVCPICLGLPGTLPVANKTAIELTLKTGLALNCEVAEFSRFDRKHYFYPDLPKGYQISQYDKPFCLNGKFEIRNPKSEIRNIRIRRVHLEEDAGKLIHVSGHPEATAEGSPANTISKTSSEILRSAQNDNNGYSLVDLNRAGTPLMEIVTEPDISTSADAKIFMQELRSILRYLDVSDADMEKGHLRCDANISISEDGRRKTEDGLGTPVEIKNLNSFRMVERALAFEEKRQKEELETGNIIVKETRGWNDAKGETYSQRGKEFAQDYRYFPEPDLPPYYPNKAFDIEVLKKELPELPAQKRKRYIEKGLPIQDAAIISIDKEMAMYFEKVAEKINPKTAANWIINELKTDGILDIAPENLISLLQKVEGGEISGKIAKEIFTEMQLSGKKPDAIIVEKGFKQIGGEKELSGIIEEIISQNEKSVADYHAGKTEALGFLVGQVMKKTSGQASPQIVNKILSEKLKG